MLDRRTYPVDGGGKIESNNDQSDFHDGLAPETLKPTFALTVRVQRYDGPLTPPSVLLGWLLLHQTVAAVTSENNGAIRGHFLAH